MIAAEHFAEPVDWPAVAELYERLVRLTASPVVELSRAVAIAAGRLARRRRSSSSTPPRWPR